MITVKFSGHSDDVVCVTDKRGDDEHDCYQSGDKDIHASFVVGGRIRVLAIYTGVWSFAAGQMAEDVPIPDWPIRIVQEHAYSVGLEIDVPDDLGIVVKEAR